MSNSETAEYLTKIRSTYNTIIKNYAELNRYFDLESPIEIYALYTKLLHRGYLSLDGSFKYDPKEIFVYNIKNLLGVDIINGNGVCRHISAMLKDIFNELKIQNEVLPVYVCDNKNTNKAHLSGNHVINLAVQNNKNYFLDPTIGYIWKKISNANLLTCNKNIEFEVARISNWVDILDYNSDNIDALKNIRKMLLMEQSTKRQDEKVLAMINRLFKDNIDIFEQFRNENIELYNDVVITGSKTKRKKAISRSK